MATEKLAAMQVYLGEHQLEALLKDVMTAVLIHKPNRPIEFMAEGLRTVQQRKDSGHPYAVADIFHELAARPSKYTSDMSMTPSTSLSTVHTASTTLPTTSTVNSNSATTTTSSTAAAETLVAVPSGAPVVIVSSVSPTKPNDSAVGALVSSPTPSEHRVPRLPPVTPLDQLLKYNMNRRNSVSAESFRPTNALAGRVFIAKSDEAKGRIAGAIANNLLFRNLDRDQRQEVVDAMFERKVAKSEDIIKQGDAGDFFYVVDEGRFEVFVKDKKVVEIGDGGSFGELALMYNTPRAATVRAVQDSVLWAVDRVTFQRIIMNNSFRKRKMYEEFLKTVPILQSLEASELVKVADAVEPVNFEDEDTIIEQGDPGDCFYIIVDGEVVITKTEPITLEDGTEDEQVIEVNRLHKGDYFGELALLTDKPRAATVTASGDVQCITLDTKSFIRLLGPTTDILKRNAETYKRYSAVLP